MTGGRGRPDPDNHSGRWPFAGDQEDPIGAILDAGYTDLIDQLIGSTDAYSYVFDGMSGYLGTMTATGPGFSFQVFGSKGWVRLEGMTHVAGASSDERRTRLFAQPIGDRPPGAGGGSVTKAGGSGEASGAAGKVPATALIQGVVTALEFTNGKAVYKIGGVTIDPADIIRIGG